MKPFSPLLLTALSPIVLSLLTAQSHARTPQSPPPNLINQGGDAVLALAAAQMSTAVVKGAPYCAEASTEVLQMLMDGNRITKRNDTRICRDGDGRIRQELVNKSPTGEARRVFISDPVSHELWLLNVNNKVAIKLPSLDTLPPPPNSGAAAPPEQQARWRDYAQRVREWARSRRNDRNDRSEPSQPSNTAATTPPQSEGEKKAIEVTRWMGGAGMAPHMLGLMNRVPDNAKAQAQTLPSKTMEGVRAEGTMTTWTIEAGAVGNEKPILITREEWRSPELKLPLYSRHADPRNGEHVYRISNLTRTPPAPELFKVPGDYRVKER
jgi:hypothetical protein